MRSNFQIASPSIDSFSTLPEQEISDFQTDSRDLQVKVDNPQKHLETLETYITFRITTRVRSILLLPYFHYRCFSIDNIFYALLQSTTPEFEEAEYVVRRRYNDFIWLRQKLVDSYPTHIIPVNHCSH